MKPFNSLKTSLTREQKRERLLTYLKHGGNITTPLGTFVWLEQHVVGQRGEMDLVIDGLAQKMRSYKGDAEPEDYYVGHGDESTADAVLYAIIKDLTEEQLFTICAANALTAHRRR